MTFNYALNKAVYLAEKIKRKSSKTGQDEKKKKKRKKKRSKLQYISKITLSFSKSIFSFFFFRNTNRLCTSFLIQMVDLKYRKWPNITKTPFSLILCLRWKLFVTLFTQKDVKIQSDRKKKEELVLL